MIVDNPERDLMFAMRFRQLWPVVRELAEARRARGDESASDFLGRYMAARDRGTGEALDMEGLVDELMTLLVAGHETSAATIAWAWSLLARHPRVQEELRAEVDGVCGEEPRLRRTCGASISRTGSCTRPCGSIRRCGCSRAAPSRTTSSLATRSRPGPRSC